jgi:hypothetical protein
MVQNLMIGTLATVSTMLSPLAHHSDRQDTFRLELDSAQTQVTCVSHNRASTTGNYIGLEVDRATDAYFTAHFKGSVCAATDTGRAAASVGSTPSLVGGVAKKPVGKLQPVEVSMNLPALLLDESFLEHLTPGLGYVVPSIPSLKIPGTNTRVKITRLKPESSSETALTPILVEWLPSAGTGDVEHPPLTVWLNKSANSEMGWQRVHLSDLYNSPADAPTVRR